jgi:peptide deformylase
MPVDDEVYINPSILKMSRGRKDKHEGCLSIRGQWGMVPRAEKATITAYDEHGKKFTRGASGFLAHIFQHETDHLNGVLYIDTATSISPDSKTSEDHE